MKSEQLNLKAKRHRSRQRTAQQNHRPDNFRHALIDRFGALSAKLDQFVVSLKRLGLQNFSSFCLRFIRKQLALKLIEHAISVAEDFSATLSRPHLFDD